MKINELITEMAVPSADLLAKTYYHGTRQEYLPLIRNNGLRPGVAGIDGPAIYLSNTIDYIYNFVDDDSIVLRISKYDLINRFGLYNYNHNKEGKIQFDGEHEIQIEDGVIPPTMIEVQINDGWKKLSKTGINEEIKHEDGLMYQCEVTDYHSGETYGYIRLFDEKTKKQIGYLDWSSYRDEVYVQMIKVESEYQRKGYATKIIKYLQEQFPNKKIVYSTTTDDGDKFLKATSERE
jgi:ribosomal protein S18 acetylase RimI-like enzyme